MSFTETESQYVILMKNGACVCSYPSTGLITTREVPRITAKPTDRLRSLRGVVSVPSSICVQVQVSSNIRTVALYDDDDTAVPRCSHTHRLAALRYRPARGLEVDPNL